MTVIDPIKVKTERIQIIDALRGFALAGIVVCHVVENFIAGPAPEAYNEAVHQGMIDNIIDGFIGIFLRGKFIALFSFLFGLSFFIQMDNGHQRGSNFAGRFFWRLMILLGIGFVHSLFYRGDILTVYAMLGVFLIPFYKASNKIVLGFSLLLFFGLARVLLFYFNGTDALFYEIVQDPNNPDILAYYKIIKNGSIKDVFAYNAVAGHLGKAEFQFNFFGRGYFTFAFFLVGLYVGRIDFFRRFMEEKKRTKKVLIYASIVFVVSIVAMAMAFMGMGENFDFNSWNAIFGFTAMDISNAAMTFIYIALFTVLYRKAKSRKWLNGLAPYGRMALTNYVSQSVIFTFVLFGWGLGLIGELRQLYTFLLAIICIALQVWLSKLWSKRFYYGPLEWLWRCLTYFKVMPFAKP